MKQTTNYNLKKPEYIDFADIQDINDNMDTIDAQLAAPTGDSADSTTTFTTSDTADGGASSWTNVPVLTSGETHKSLFAKMSQMFKNIRFLYKLLGTTDISSIGNGTVTGGLSSLNDSLPDYDQNHAVKLKLLAILNVAFSNGQAQVNLSSYGTFYQFALACIAPSNTTAKNIYITSAYIPSQTTLILTAYQGTSAFTGNVSTVFVLGILR